MNVVADYGGGAVASDLDEACRNVAALRRIISAVVWGFGRGGREETGE